MVYQIPRIIAIKLPILVKMIMMVMGRDTNVKILIMMEYLKQKTTALTIRIQIKKILMMINLYPVFPCINPIDLFDDANIYVPGNNIHRSR
jgi:hypothetical protein